MRMSLMVVLMICISFYTAYGQSKEKAKNLPLQNADSIILSDTFRGASPMKTLGSDAELVLKHCPYCDEGTFSLTAVKRYSIVCNSTGISGEWTVLRGDATNDNATVVELDEAGGKPLCYFLRLKNGDLQQLDSTLHQIKPVSKHILRREPKRKL